ncbi:penicillin-binding transpeptidase domain-containing protein [Isoptericola sp. MSP01]|uniref:Beta-lactamase n=1 Tax=Isoptericola haloaureus TaxID=1542902 RepID=A0ABU7Z7K1_9MICO
MRRRTSCALTVLLTPAVLAAAAACTGPERPAPDETAQALADGLARQDLSALTLVSDTSALPEQHLIEVVEPLLAAAEETGAASSVEVAEVVEAETAEDEPPRAAVTLAWSWPLAPGHTWDYTTDTELVWAPPPEDSEETGTWEVQWQHDLVAPDLAGGERLELESLEPDRGDLLDIHGERLVTERDVWRIGIDKTYLEPPRYAEQSEALAELVGLDPAAYADRVASAGEKAYVLAITIRQDEATSGVSFTADDARAIDGVNVLADTMELAPTSSFARSVLGRAGEATAEIIEQSDGAVEQGDVVGISGLQRQYDAALTGSEGLAVHVVDGDGEVVRDAYRVEAVDGADVATTFEPDLQILAEEVLSDVEPASAIVAVRPSTGEVLAAASGPGGEGWSTATLGQYAPGSTFKVATALSLMRAGVFPEDEVTCPTSVTVDGRTYENVPGYPQDATGAVSLRTAFAHSCNTAMIGEGAEVRQADLAAAAVDLGLGAASSVGAPAFLGEVPTEASATGHAEALIGQGAVLASPLGMATVAASVAAGERVEPVLVRPVEDDGAADDGAADDGGTDDGGTGASPSASASPDASPDASADTAEEPEPAGSAGGLTQTEAADLHDLMGAVVAEGSASALADVPGVTGAKTGTAQYGDGSRQHAWMLAIADDLAVAVFVEDGEYGSTTAGPLMGRFLTGR